MVQNLSAPSGADVNAASASAALGLNNDVRAKHRSDAERIDCTDGVKLAAVKLYAMFCPIAGKRIGITTCRA
jgi:hypothetical protein